MNVSFTLTFAYIRFDLKVQLKLTNDFKHTLMF